MSEDQDEENVLPGLSPFPRIVFTVLPDLPDLPCFPITPDEAVKNQDEENVLQGSELGGELIAESKNQDEENVLQGSELGGELMTESYITPDEAVKNQDEENVLQESELRLGDELIIESYRTPEEAVKNGDLNKLKELLNKQDSVIEFDIGRNLLHTTAECGHLGIIKFLIDQDVIDINVVDQDRRNVLHIAGREGNTEIVKYLIESCNMDVNVVDGRRSNVLHKAGYGGNIEIVKYLIESCNMDVNVVDQRRSNVLHNAGYGGNIEIVKYLIESCNMDVNVVDEYGENVLHRSGNEGNMEIVKYLIESCNMDVNVVDRSRSNVLLNAGCGGNIEIVKYLIESCNMDVNIVDEYGENVLHRSGTGDNIEIVKYLIESCNMGVNVEDQFGQNVLHRSGDGGNIEIVKYLIESCNMDVNVVDQWGVNVLHYTGGRGNIEIVKYLIESCNMNVNVVDQDGMNVLHRSGGGGNIEIVKYLIESCNMDVNVVDEDGQNVLHRSGSGDNIEIVKYLIESCNMDVNAVDQGGRNVLHWLGWGYNIEIVKYLIESCNMDVNAVDKDGKNVLLHHTGRDPNLLNFVNSALCRKCNKEMVKYLIESCKINMSCCDNDGQTTLHNLSLLGEMKLVQFVLDHCKADIDIDKKNKLGYSALDIATENKDSKMFRLLMNYGADIKYVTSNINKMYILLEDIVSSTEILIDRVYAFYGATKEIDHDEMKQIFLLIEMGVTCSDSEDPNHAPNIVEKLKTTHRERLQELCSLKNVRELNNYAIILKMMELLTDPENNNNRSRFSKIEEKVVKLANGCYTKIFGSAPTERKKSHIETCHMTSWSTIIFSLFFIWIHIYDIVSDFKIGSIDRNSNTPKIRTLGTFEITIVFLFLIIENIQSAYNLFRDEKLRLSLVKKKSKLDLELSDWDTLNFREHMGYQILILAFWPFKIRDQSGKLLKRSIIFNILCLLQLRPIVDRLRPLFHDSSSRHLFFISEANAKFLQQGYVVFDQIPEFLIQVYTLHIALSKNDNIMHRVISLLMPILTIPRGIISFEECIRKIDPSIVELGNSKYILLVSHILTIPGRLFLLSSVMFLSDRPYVIGYIILRIVFEFALNCKNSKNIFTEKTYKSGKPLENEYFQCNNPTDRFVGQHSSKNTWTRRIKFIYRLLMCSIRDVFIVSIRSAEGYIQPPVNVTSKSIRTNRNILSRYFVMILESIAMTLLTELFYNPDDNEKYKHGIWIKEAAWIVTILLVTSTTILYLIINFIHHERFLNSLRENFNWRIAKSFTGGLIIVISLMSIKQHYFGSSIPMLYYYLTGYSFYLIVLVLTITVSNSMFNKMVKTCRATSLRVVDHHDHGYQKIENV